MNSTSNDLSYSSFINFLDWVSSKGIIKSATVSALRAASNKVFGILDDDEKSNRSLIDVFGYKPNSEIEWLDINLEEMIVKSYVFMRDVIAQITGIELEEEFKTDTAELLEYVTDYLSPDILK